MFFKNQKPTLAVGVPLRTISLAGVVVAGMFSTACASGTAMVEEPQEVQSPQPEHTVVEQRVVKELINEDGEVVRSEHIFITDGGDVEHIQLEGGNNLEFMSEDGTHILIEVDNTDGEIVHMSKCEPEDGESEPVVLEWKDESEDGSQVEVSVICLTGDEAKPENQVAALEQAIARMEAQGAEEAARRAKMIEELRKKIEKLKAESE